MTKYAFERIAAGRRKAVEHAKDGGENYSASLRRGGEGFVDIIAPDPALVERGILIYTANYGVFEIERSPDLVAWLNEWRRP